MDCNFKGPSSVHAKVMPNYIGTHYTLIWAGNFRMMDIGINALSTLFFNLEIKYCLLSSVINLQIN